MISIFKTHLNKLLVFLLVVTIPACVLQNQLTPMTEVTITTIQSITHTPTFKPTITPTATPTPIPPTSTVEKTPLPPVAEEYLPYTTEFLRNRAYGGGQIEILEVIEKDEHFTCYAIRYPSDGLNIYGVINVPNREGPFPIIIMLHGYRNPRNPPALALETCLNNGLVEHGYIVLSPNMRGYPPSENGDELYRVGFAVDILNLIALLKEQSGQPGPFANADFTNIGLWGSSLGGGVALRVATVTEDIKAIVLQSSISADEFKNAELFYGLTKMQIYLTEMETPPDVMDRISPLNYFDKINASVKLYHSLDDDVVPAAWAIENCDEMKANAVDIDCFYYIGADHTFSSGFNKDFSATMLDFFESKFKKP